MHVACRECNDDEMAGVALLDPKATDAANLTRIRKMLVQKNASDLGEGLCGTRSLRHPSFGIRHSTPTVSFAPAQAYSRFSFAMTVAGISAGQTASHS